MPSSTSNSDAPGARPGWGRSWLLAAGLSLLFLAGLEAAWRSRGHVASARDTPLLWASIRRRAEGMRRPAAVIIGASRAQFGIDPDDFEAATGWPAPLQLSIAGSSPLPVLNDLAGDESFAGLVVCDVTPRILFQSTRAREGYPKALIEACRGYSASYSEQLELRLALAIQDRLVLRSPQLLPDRLLRLSAAGEKLRPSDRSMRSDRSRKMDFRRNDANRMLERWVDNLRREQHPPTAEGLEEILGEIVRATRAIRGRGGEVVFVRLPSTRELWTHEQRKFPRRRFWDVMVERVGGPAIHFRDEPALAETRCPDGSHIDQRDVPAFTRALAHVIERRLEKR